MLGIGSGLMYTNWREGGPAIQGSEYSISFDGSGYLDTNNTHQSTFRGSFTLAWWCKITSGASLESFFTAGQEADHVWIYKQHRKIVVFLTFNGDTVTATTDAAHIASGQTDWVHLAITVTLNSSGDTSFIVYVDGQPVDTSVTIGGLSDTNHELYTTSENLLVGCRNEAGTLDEFFDGLMDEVAFWSEALTADNIEKVYNSGIPFDLTDDVGAYDNSNTLVGYWRMNEGSGITAADTGGSNDATLKGLDYSISLDGTNDYLDTGNTYQSTFRDSFTIACWFKWNGSNTNGDLWGAVEVGGGGSNADRLYLWLHYGKLRLKFYGDNNDNLQQNTDNVVFAAGDGWKHVVVTITKTAPNSICVIYINGLAVDSTEYTAITEANHAAYTTTQDFYFGCENKHNYGASFFQGGLMDDIAIWSEALTAANILKVYNSGAPFDLTDDTGGYDNSNTLVGYWRVNEGSGTTAIDTGGSNNITLTGGATYSTNTPLGVVDPTYSNDTP